MDLKKIVLTFVALGALGWVAWENRVPIAEALGIEIETPEQLRSIDLAKKGYDLDRYRQNHEVVRGNVDLLGRYARLGEWTSVPQGGTIYLVGCSYRYERKTGGWYFEVDAGRLTTRAVTGNRELEKKYGIPAAPR